MRKHNSNKSIKSAGCVIAAWAVCVALIPLTACGTDNSRNSAINPTVNATYSVPAPQQSTKPVSSSVAANTGNTSISTSASTGSAVKPSQEPAVNEKTEPAHEPQPVVNEEITQPAHEAAVNEEPPAEKPKNPFEENPYLKGAFETDTREYNHKPIDTSTWETYGFNGHDYFR